MTYREAIAYVRSLLDESGIEAYSDDDILGCIGEAQVAKAREYYQRGEKEAIRPLYREDVVGLSSGNTSRFQGRSGVCAIGRIFTVSVSESFGEHDDIR